MGQAQSSKWAVERMVWNRDLFFNFVIVFFILVSFACMHPCRHDSDNGSDDDDIFLPADVRTPFHLTGHIQRFCLFAALYSSSHFEMY